MVDNHLSSGKSPRGADPSAAWDSFEFSPSSLVESLTGLRQRVLERLDELETLVQERPVSASASADEGQDELLERKQVALEEAENRLKAQAERQDKEWAALLNQLEADRRLLAEAWERIEQERIEAVGLPVDQAGTHALSRSLGHGHGLQRRGTAPLSNPTGRAAGRSTPSESDPYHAPGQEILRQFQTLCSDVRRTAAERREPRDKGRRSES